MPNPLFKNIVGTIPGYPLCTAVTRNTWLVDRDSARPYTTYSKPSLAVSEGDMLDCQRGLSKGATTKELAGRT